MGASSVTGVGNGSAEPVKGPGNGRNEYCSLINPRIVAAGNLVTTDPGKVGTVVFGNALPSAPSNYIVKITPINSVVGVNQATIAKVGSSTFTGFTVAADVAAETIGWAVISVG